ncbi:hypothetical protein D3C76_1028850 [compost metagenome]
MLFGEIKIALADSAFGLDQHFITHTRIVLKYPCEYLFSFAVRINVGMIKEVYSELQRTMYMCISFFCR